MPFVQTTDQCSMQIEKVTSAELHQRTPTDMQHMQYKVSCINIILPSGHSVERLLVFLWLKLFLLI